MEKHCLSHSKDVYQFKVILRDISPSVWRRIQVPRTYNFWDLHMVIQSVMGWTDGHFHQFSVMYPTYNHIRDKLIIAPKLRETQDKELDKDYILSSKETLLSEIFSSVENSPKVIYEYDFNSGWEHTVVFEKIVKPESGVKYPCCISGFRASPPEQIGGVDVYKKFLKYFSKYVKKNRRKEKESICKCMKECVHCFARRMFHLGFKPELFDVESVYFYDPEFFWKCFTERIVTVPKNWMIASD